MIAPHPKATSLLQAEIDALELENEHLKEMLTQRADELFKLWRRCGYPEMRSLRP